MISAVSTNHYEKHLVVKTLSTEGNGRLEKILSSMDVLTTVAQNMSRCIT